MGHPTPHLPRITHHHRAYTFLYIYHARATTMLSRFMWLTLLPFLTAASTAETEPPATQAEEKEASRSCAAIPGVMVLQPKESVHASPYAIERGKPLVAPNILDELSKDPIFKKLIDYGNEYMLLSSVLRRNEGTVDQFGRLLCFMIDNKNTDLERLGDFARVHIMGMIGARVPHIVYMDDELGREEDFP